MIASSERRSTIKSLMTGNARARHGSTRISSPSWKCRMCSWHVAVPPRGPWAMPLIIMPHAPQMPSRQSCSKWIGSSPFSISCSLTMSSISRKDASGLISRASYCTKRPSALPVACRQTCSVRFIVCPSFRSAVPWHRFLTKAAASRRTPKSFVAPRGQLDLFVRQRLRVQARLIAHSGELPRRDIAELLVIAQRLAVGRLMFHPKVAAARFLAMQRIDAHQFGQLEEIGDASCFFQGLIHLFAAAENTHVAPVQLAQATDFVPRFLQTIGAARPAAVLPHDISELAMERVDGARSLR